MNHERIDHVQFAMPAGEEERAQVFYRDGLGFPELPKPSHLAVRGGAWFDSDEVKVHLGLPHRWTPHKTRSDLAVCFLITEPAPLGKASFDLRRFHCDGHDSLIPILRYW